MLAFPPLLTRNHFGSSCAMTRARDPTLQPGVSTGCWQEHVLCETPLLSSPTEMRTLITREIVCMAFVENTFGTTSYNSWMMQESAKSSLLSSQSGRNALVGPCGTFRFFVPYCFTNGRSPGMKYSLHAFLRLHSSSPITSSPERRTLRRCSTLRRLWEKNPLPTK